MDKASHRKPQQKKQGPALKKTDLSQHFLTRPFPVFLLLAMLATLIYSNTFSVPFVFDDVRNVIENSRIKELRNFLDFSGSRYMGFLSFALNYHFGQLNPFGYHLVNLFIHVTNGFLVYLLVLLLFRTPTIVSCDMKVPSSWIAFATALLFISHPIQTQAVTYIVQRFASLATLFYLLAVVSYMKWRQAESKEGYLWYGFALLSTILAMKTKEISFTLPAMLLLIEKVFFRRREGKQWIALVPFLVTLLIIPFSRIDVVGGAENGFAQETTEIGRSKYLFTQFRVIITYVRLLLFPMNQNLDYDYPIYRSLFDPSVSMSVLFLSVLLVLAIYFVFISSSALFRLIGFGILWFFLALSIESSIIPIRDVIFEHRLYLPSIGFFMVFSLFFFSTWDRMNWYIPAFVSIVFIFSIATYRRNNVWIEELTLWQDVVSKSPMKARGHNNLGDVFSRDNKIEEAIAHYAEALRIDPDYINAHINIGVDLEREGKLQEAEAHYREALQIDPQFRKLYFNLGLVLMKQERLDQAAEFLQKALQLDPEFVLAHNLLGEVFGHQGRLADAMMHYSEALRMNPHFAEAHDNLGVAFTKQGKFAEAVDHFLAAIQDDPSLERAYNNLGVAYYRVGRLESAAQAFETILKINPQFTEAHQNLAIVRDSRLKRP